MSLVVVLILPLIILAGLVLGRVPRRMAFAAAPLAPLALLWPFFDGSAIELDYLLIETSLGADEAIQPLLLLTALAWTLAGVHARLRGPGESGRFWCGWLACLFGTSLLLLAGDLASFYFGYATVSLSAYLLVTHEGSPAAWRAGRVYLVMALLGEAFILAGVMLIAGQLGNADWQALAENPLSDSPARWLFFTGFAVKMGILPLHLWLPLAHPAAPVPASAILSGVIVKAGLVGWIRLVLPDAADATFIAPLLLGIGLATAFGGALLGLTQSRIKTVLAYSTVSQMGLILCAFALLFPAAQAQSQEVIAIIGLMALHHGLCKSSLFLACDCAPGRRTMHQVLFALPALSIAAAPLTAGYLAKAELKSAAEAFDPGTSWLLLLALTSTATTLVLWHAWRLSARLTEGPPSPPAAWTVLTALALLIPWAWAGYQDLLYGLSLSGLWSASWPLLLGFALILAWRLAGSQRPLRLPEGDLVVLFEALAGRLVAKKSAETSRVESRRPHARQPWIAAITGLERSLRTIPLAGLVLLAIGGLLWLSAWLITASWPG